MAYLIYFLGLIWLFKQTKVILFWLYLWQLKEYHIGRFLDHFRTYKGKRLLLDKLLILKLFLALLVFFSLLFKSYIYLVLVWVLLVLYFFELAIFFYNFFSKKLKKPVFTKKIILLVFLSFSFGVFYLLSLFQDKLFVFWLLIFDILSSFIFSGIILFFQPLVVSLRNQVINKAKRKREGFKDLLVIGITGSYGKTSTKEFLYTILSEKFRVLKTKEHQNSEIGVSNCVLNDLNENHQIFIAEMGAYNKGGIKFISDVVKPKIGILTGINEQHLALFGSLENTIKTKYELIDNLPDDGLAILNGNNDIIRSHKPSLENVRFCSTKERMDLWAEDIKIEKDRIIFKAFSKDGDSALFNVNLLGSQSIENILLAAACAKELGMSLEEISKACANIKQEKGAMRLVTTKDGLNIIDSSYSANPDGVISHLEYLEIWKGKKMIVMPSLIELGQASSKIHREIGQKIGLVCELAIITTKDKFKELKEGALASGLSEENILFIEDSKSVFDKIRRFSHKEDIILLEGRIPSGIKKLLWKSER
ncbi:MAG: UDP-N-acetylmuramoyl-tripeptide--D-alanyl-D-alanine ligase [Patescibacteria group bacterium]|nr:UDP-N-acetylmuramoyl-tripeptide--D-alanyl-D-alanine ligase [Patescibacteria group bacterium]